MFAKPQAASPAAFFHSKNDQSSSHRCKVHATLKPDTEVHPVPAHAGAAVAKPVRSRLLLYPWQSLFFRSENAL